MSPAAAGKVIDFPVTDNVSPAAVLAVAEAETRAAEQFVEDNKVAVVDLVSLGRAVQTRTAIGQKQKEIIAKLAKPKSWAHQLHAWFCNLESAALAPYNRLDTYERDQIRAFNEAETRRRQAREREIADQQRIEQQTRAAAEAAALESAGEHALAAAVVEEAIAAPPPVVVLPDETRQIEGLKFTTRYLWRFVNGPKEVEKTPPDVLARAMNLIPREYLMPDTKRIGAYARAMKGAAKVPGIEFYSVEDPVR